MDTHEDSAVSLREHVDVQLDAIRRELELRMIANQTAIDKAESTMNWRLASLNEFRSSLQDQTKLYTTRAELESLRESQANEIKSLSRQLYIIVGALAAVQVLLQFLVK